MNIATNTEAPQLANSEADGVVNRAWLVNDADRITLAVFFIGYLLLCVLGYQLRIDAFQAALMWPAAGLLIPVLVITRVRRWWRIVVAAIAAESLTLFYAQGAVNLPLGLIFPLANAVEGMAGAALILLLVSHPWHRRSSFEITAAVVVCAVIVPGIGAVLAAPVLGFDGVSISSTVGEFRARWAAHLLGIILTAPVIGGMVLYIAVGENLSLRRGARSAAVLLLALASIFFLLGPYEIWPQLVPEYRLGIALIVSSAALAWFALREEPVVVASASFFVALMVAALMTQPEATVTRLLGSERIGFEATQLFVTLCSLAAFLLSVAVFERRHVRRLMSLRRQNSSLVAGLASRLAGVGMAEFDDALRACLEDIGRHAGADRCVVAQFDRRRQLISETHSWVREGLPQTQPIAKNLSFDDFPRGMRSILQGRSQFSRRSDHPPGDPAGVFMDKTGTRAAGFMPLRRRETIFGLLGLIWVRREITWTDRTAGALRATAEIIGSSLARARAEAGSKIYQDNLRKLALHADQLDDAVRRETASDLHDGAAQYLAVARMKVAEYQTKRQGEADTLEQVDALIELALNEVRDVIERIGSVTLDELGLMHALTEYIRQTRKFVGVQISLTADRLEHEPAQAVAAALYRAARELIANAVKHAEASSVDIVVEQDAGGYRLIVADNGSGMQPSEADRYPGSGSGLGLLALGERVSSLNGKVRIMSGNTGTEVIVSIPHGE